MELITLPVGVNQTNTYIIINSNEAVVIDPGAQARHILSCVNERGATIRHILITHAHFDHIGAVAELKNSEIDVYMSDVDTELCDKICSVGMGFYVEPFKTDVQICDGMTLDLIGSEFKVIATPGHTPGSVCFIQDDRRIFSGDTLFRLGVGRTDFIGGDSQALKNSIKKLFALPHDYDIFPGHGSPTSLSFERANNRYVD